LGDDLLTYILTLKLTPWIKLTLWHPAAFNDFQKKSLNACGFAQVFLRPGMLYRPGKSLKRHGKSSSLH